MKSQSVKSGVEFKFVDGESTMRMLHQEHQKIGKLVQATKLLPAP